MHGMSLDLREVTIFLFAAGLVVPIARRFKISPVFGFLVVGVLIGPYGLARFTESLPWLAYGLITNIENVRLLAELGVVFLLFMIGLELSLERLWAMHRKVFGLGGAQILISGTIISLVAVLFGNPIVVAVVLGSSFALSSTAIVMQLLTENRRIGTATGQTCFSILLCQDLAVLPILFLVGVFASQSDTAILPAFLLAMGEALVAVVVILALGRLIIGPLLKFVGSTASREMFLALVLLVIFGISIITEHFGMSLALGAFLAGLLFAETEYRHEIEVDIEPFKGLLLGLFFMSIGMSIDISQLAENPFWLFASIIGLYLIKTPIIYVLARLFGESRPVALEAGLLLGQGGEFAFIVVGLALSLGILPDKTAQFMLIVASLTMMVTPLIAQVARRLASAIETKQAQNGQGASDTPNSVEPHVIIVGYGRVGQLLGSLLDSQEIPHVGLDTDASLVAGYHSDGACVFYGDAQKTEILKKFNIDKADALVVTMNDPVMVEKVVANVRKHWPSLRIYARAHDRNQAAELIAKGATYSIPETIEASLQLGEIVLTGVGVPSEAARKIVDGRRPIEYGAPNKT